MAFLDAKNLEETAFHFTEFSSILDERNVV